MNRIRARLACSFQGRDYDLDTLIDLDAARFAQGEPPDFHRVLAEAAGIDTYSYLYEVVEMQDIEFSEATGEAARHCHGGVFDWCGFQQARPAAVALQRVQDIAAQHLGIGDLAGQPQLRAALLAAYRAGEAAGTGMEVDEAA